MKIDEVDLAILKELGRDGRQSFRDIAEKLTVSEGTVYNRVNKLREQEVIKSFIANIDYSKLGYDLTAIIGIRAKGGKLQEIEKRVAAEKNVTAVYDVTGEYDALVVAKFPDRDALNKLVKKLTALDDVERTYTMVVLNVIKEAHGINIEVD
ncbi:MAG: Lrp/AsnC family transcriptional regulator [Candidatus Altiarchaeota archaeon]|nr:Lrp/AsnC family transcriptional regulator [Candidatus Altiarchaeota archaeon]